MTAERRIPRLHVVTDTEALERPDFLDLAGGLLAAGSAARPIALHLRGTVHGRLLHDLAVALVPLAEGVGASLLINDRVDVALTAGAHGVQLRQGSLPVASARRMLGPTGLIGASVHGGDEALSAASADFLIVGNIWETHSHPDRPAAGTERLRHVSEALDGLTCPPLMAIGGVTPQRVSSAIAAGATGVAVLSGIWSAASPSEAAFRYLEALELNLFDPESGS